MFGALTEVKWQFGGKRGCAATESLRLLSLTTESGAVRGLFHPCVPQTRFMLRERITPYLFETAAKTATCSRM
jgi:hypothetical protein